MVLCFVPAQGLKGSSFLASVLYVMTPKQKVGHTQQRTTLEPLGKLKKYVNYWSSVLFLHVSTYLWGLGMLFSISSGELDCVDLGPSQFCRVVA